MGGFFVFVAVAAGGLVALVVAAARVRVALGFSAALFADGAFIALIAATAAALAGDAGFGGIGTVMLGLRGDVARGGKLFWGEPSCGRMGLW